MDHLVPHWLLPVLIIFFVKSYLKAVVDHYKNPDTKFHDPSFISSLTVSLRITKEYIGEIEKGP